MSPTPSDQYRPYLKVFIIWHPGMDRPSANGKTNSGRLLAERLYRHFCRDPQTPVSTALGIPVHLLTSADKGHTPTPVNLVSALHSVVVFLVNPSMALDESWKQFVADVAQRALPESGHLVLPVFLRGTGGELGLSGLQGIRISTDSQEEEVPDHDDARDVQLIE